MADPVPGEKWDRNSDSVEFIVARVEGDNVLLASAVRFERVPKTGFDTNYTKQE
jgi:hypothetical protein